MTSADAGVGTVDLVDHQDHREVASERLAQHETGLRQRPLGGVDQQHDAIDHREGTLDLAPEVGVAGCVDDVQRGVGASARIVPDERGVLGENRDPLLTFEVARIHDAIDDLLVRAERPGLVEHRVDEGGLAVVDVRDDREVADVGAMTHVRSPGQRVVGHVRRPSGRREGSGRGGTRHATLSPFHERTIDRWSPAGLSAACRCRVSAPRVALPCLAESSATSR